MMNKIKKNPRKAIAVFIMLVAIGLVIFFEKINSWFRGLGADLGTIVYTAIIIFLMVLVVKFFFFSKKK